MRVFSDYADVNSSGYLFHRPPFNDQKAIPSRRQISMANSMIHQAGHSQSADEGRRQPFGGLSMTLPPKSSMQNPEQIPSIASWSPLQSNRARYATHIHLARQSCPEARRSRTASRPEAPSPWPEAQLPPPRVPQWPPTSPWQPATRESAFSMQVLMRSASPPARYRQWREWSR